MKPHPWLMEVARCCDAALTTGDLTLEQARAYFATRRQAFEGPEFSPIGIPCSDTGTK